MPNDGNERIGHANQRLVLSLLALVGVATCFVFGEWQILSPFTRLLSSSAVNMDRAVSGLMPGAILEKVRDMDKKTEDQKPRIKRIVLLGERHSGTSYTTRKLAECFPDLEVTDLLVRYKHWFQPTPEYVVNVTKTFYKDNTLLQDETLDMPDTWPEIASMKDPKNAFEDTLLILMFRNVYDWLDAMREGPHHWPNHLTLFRFPDGPKEDIHGNGLMHEYGVHTSDWTSFIKANMTLARDIGDTTQLCQNGFLYNTVSPCVRSKELYPDVVRKDYAPDMNAAPDILNFNANRPIYELDEAGKPFANPLAFRTAKMQNFLDIPNHWNLGGFMTLQHEEENEKGSEFVLNKVAELVGRDFTCEADPPKHQQHKQMNKEWEQWITNNADWRVEGRVGYKPRPVEEEKQETKVVENVAESKVQVVPQVQETPKAVATEAPRFDRIVLLGERHSGTTYTTRTLERCFPDVDVSDFLVRFKHWFQPTPEYVATTTKAHLKNDVGDDTTEDMYEIYNQWPNIAAMDNPKAAFKNTLLIVMFRNPYDWLEAMRVGPHHWTNHFKMYRFPRAPVPETTGNPWYGSNFSTWADFVTAEMTLDVDDGSEGTVLCQNAFMKGSVTPCLKSKKIYPQEVQKDYPQDINEAPDQLPFNAHHPIYELDPDGKPYADPLAFRAAKIQNFLDIPNQWDIGSFMTLQHEEVNEKGSGFLLEKVSEILGQKPECEADPPKSQPHKILNPDWSDYITQHMDWETEAKVGYERRPKASRPNDAVVKKQEEEPMKRIVLLGERHSGTSYTTKMLAKCFPKLQVGDVFGRYKHWFQPTPEYMANATKTFLKDPDTPEGALTSTIQNQWPELMAGENPKSAFKDTLVIVMFRNAYDWLEAMREGPHHWPNHFDTVRIKKGVYEIKSFGWNKFVNADMKLSGDDSVNSPICQFAYPTQSVSPCLKSKNLYPTIVKDDYADNLDEAPDRLPFNAHNPIYELDKNGKPFSHPLELRAAKIKDFLNLPNHWDLGGFIKTQYEEMNMKGNAFLLEQVSKIVGMEPECKPDPPRNHEVEEELESDWLDWITTHADWEIEKMVGYEPRVTTNSREKVL